MRNFYYIKVLGLSLIAFCLANLSVAQEDKDEGLSNEDFLPIDSFAPDSPYKKSGSDKKKSKGKAKEDDEDSSRNKSKDEDSSEDDGEDKKGDKAEDKDEPKETPRKPKRSSSYNDSVADKDYFDASYIRKAAFFDLPFLDVDPEELSEREKDRLISTLKRRLSIYNSTVKRIEARIKDIGGDDYFAYSSKSSYSSKKSFSMPVEIDGKEYDAVNGILVASSKNSRATAFFATIKNRNFIVTNMHVMQSDSDVNFRTYNGIEIKMPKVGFFSKGKDVFILPIASIPDGCIALPIEENVSQNLSVSDQVIACGNSMGGGSLVHKTGEVVAVGPEIVEHSCNIQKGHSGSPIYSRKLRKVVGVISHKYQFTYREKDKKIGKNPNANLMIGERDFGYRIDNVKDWTQIKTEKLIELSRDFDEFQKKYKHLAKAINENAYIRGVDYRELGNIIASFRSKNTGSSVAFKEAKLEFYKNLKNLIGHEIVSIKNKKLDDVFADTTSLIDAFEELQKDCASMMKTEM